VTSLASEDAAVDVVLALDTSGSMAGAVNQLKQAAGDFLRALRPQDAVTVASFNQGLSVVSPRGATLASRLAAVDGLSAFGTTAFYDALIRSVELVKTGTAHRAVVAFTDGDDVASRSSVESVRTALQTNDVVLYVIAQGKAADDKHLRDQLQSLAAETGGAAFFAARMSDLRDHFAQIVADLANQYVLVYMPLRPFGDGGWRRITVQVDRRYKVRAREGYVAIRSGGSLHP
jgi:Ca-activated chloride channel homolog